jgi:multidrug efflux pump subunit AcrB
MALYLLKAKPESTSPSRNPLARFQQAFERAFERTRHRYRDLLATLIAHRVLFIGAFLGVCVLTAVLVPLLGQDFFPSSDTGQFILHVRARSGTRIEETARLVDLVESSIRRHVPAAEIDNILDNIGLPYSGINRLLKKSAHEAQYG